MNGVTMFPRCPARVARRLGPAALVCAGLAFSPVASADPVDLPKVPLGPLETTPYTPSDPMMTMEQFQADIAKVKTAPFAWSWTEGRTSFAEPPADQESIDAAIEKIESGRLDVNADIGPGSSVLGVPNAQTLVHSTIMGSKTINGQLSQAVCQYEIFTGTPNATRQIEIGAAWYCNQSWVRGAVSAAGAGLNRPDGSVALYPLPIAQPYLSIDGSAVNRTIYSKVTFSRGFEIQIEDIYGYVNLFVDSPSSPNDNFLGRPSAEGAYSSYNCAATDAQHATCEFISDPFTFVPTANTQCTTGDACGGGPQQTVDAYLVTDDTEDPDVPTIPVDAAGTDGRSGCVLVTGGIMAAVSSCGPDGTTVRGPGFDLDWHCTINPKNVYRSPGRGKLGPYQLRSTVVTDCTGDDVDDIDRITIGSHIEKADPGGFYPAPYGSDYHEPNPEEKTVFRQHSNYCRKGTYRLHIYWTIYDDQIPKTSQNPQGRLQSEAFSKPTYIPC